MKQKDVLFIALGVGAVYLLTRPSVTYPGTTAPGVPVGGVPGVGSLVSSLSNLLSGFLHPGVSFATPSNPSINPVNSPSSYPNFTGSPGAPVGDTYSPCDPNSVNYSPDVCAEMYPNG